MRELLCEIFAVNDDQLDGVLDHIESQVAELHFTPDVRSTLGAVLSLQPVDEMVERLGISRDVAHSRRSRLGYGVLRKLLDAGLVSVGRRRKQSWDS